MLTDVSLITLCGRRSMKRSRGKEKKEEEGDRLGDGPPVNRVILFNFSRGTISSFGKRSVKRE